LSHVKKNLTPADKQASLIVEHMKQYSHVLVSTDGPFHNVIKIKPPMCWTMEDADLFVGALEKAILAL